MTCCAAWIIATVTRPLRDLTDAVAAAQRGLRRPAWSTPAAPAACADAATSSGSCAQAFDAMLTRLRSQWDALRRLDQFRRESVSNLSHDLRSPLTATVGLPGNARPPLGGDAGARRRPPLVEVALRNTRNAARLVQSLGDLAQLDEPEFKLQHR